MGWILRLLGGSGGIWFLIGGLAAAGVAGAGAGYAAASLVDAPQLAQLRTDVANAKNETLTCQRDREKNRADGNAKTAGDLQKSISNLNQAIADLEKQKAARDASTEKFLSELGQLPQTSVCAGSPPEHAYRVSVQPRRPAVP